MVNKYMKKLAIIGASYLQEPLIQKAKSMGLETHVFAWAANDVGEKSADFFYPISIIEKELILSKCQEIGIDGICSIASDVAVITVNYVANAMGLVGNSDFCTKASTNKYLMRRTFQNNGDPSPKSIMVSDLSEVEDVKKLTYPLVVKPTDRSGSRGITKIEEPSELENAVKNAVSQGFEKRAVIEEYIDGNEYSVEYISYKGKHHFLALTQKFTTGAPNFIEKGHIEPAPVTEDTLSNIKRVVLHALDSLDIKNGASHSEVKVSDNGEVKIVEIGSRMGGDFIGSSLVELSTGVDFVKAVIDVALGNDPFVCININQKKCASGVRYIFSEKDVCVLEDVKKNHPEYLVAYNVEDDFSNEIKDSSSRHGYFILSAENYEDIVGAYDNI